MTRIASGCTEEELAALRAAYAKLDRGRNKFRLHGTPDFSIDGKTGKKYYFYNSTFVVGVLVCWVACWVMWVGVGCVGGSALFVSHHSFVLFTPHT